LVGWATLPVQGEVWIVKTQRGGDAEFNVAFDSLNIESDIAIPICDAENEAWQPGYYMQMSSTNDEWKNWNGANTFVSMPQFLKLWKALDVKSASELLKSKKFFELYSGQSKADSVTAYLNDFEFQDGTSTKIRLILSYSVDHRLRKF
jgi:hypothetical protein